MALNKKLALERHRAWKENPALFVTDNWPEVKLEPFQAEALQALSGHGRVSIRSGHGVGKSTLGAWSVLWFLCTHFPAKVPVAAPTAHQLHDVIRPEIGRWLRKSEWMSKEFELKKEKLELKAAPNESFAAFRTGNKSNPDALQGFHSDNLFFVLDEASGIDDKVFEVAEGALSTKGSKQLLTGNPTKTTGYFYNSHQKAADAFYTMRVSCHDSSRVGDAYAKNMARDYGLESNVYRVRVLGEFPTSDDDAVIPMEWVESAVRRETRLSKDDPVVWGLDVARFGSDRTTLAKRQGRALLEKVQSWRNKDTQQVAGIIQAEYKGAEREERPVAIYIDTIGVGAGVYDSLHHAGLPVVGINVAERPASVEKYMRYRDELWFLGREWFEGLDVVIPDQEELRNELIAQKFAIQPNGKIKVESKEEMRRDGRASPDLADAFLLTFGIARKAPKKERRPIDYSLGPRFI